PSDRAPAHPRIESCKQGKVSLSLLKVPAVTSYPPLVATNLVSCDRLKDWDKALALSYWQLAGCHPDSMRPAAYPDLDWNETDAKERQKLSQIQDAHGSGTDVPYCLHRLNRLWHHHSCAAALCQGVRRQRHNHRLLAHVLFAHAVLFCAILGQIV